MDGGSGTEAFQVGTSTIGLDLDDVLRAAQEAGVGLWEWDVSSGRVLADQTAAKLLGVDAHPGPVTIDDLIALVHPDERAAIERARDASLRSSGNFLEEYRVLRPDGSVTWVQTRGRMLVDATSGAQRVIGLCTDRTPVKSVQERLARALDYVSDIVVVLDETDRVVYANPEATRQLHRTGGDGDLVGRCAGDVLMAPVRDHVSAIRRRRADQAGGEAVDAVLEVEVVDDLGAWWAIRIFVIPDGLVVTMRDIEARRRADVERAELIGSLSSALRWSRQLLEVTVELGQGLTVEQLCDVAAASARTGLGVLFTGVVLIEEEGPPQVLTRPASAMLTERWRTMPDFGPAVTRELLSTHEPRFDVDRTSYLRDFPDRAPNLDAIGIDAVASLPLIVSGRPIGVMLLGWPRAHAFDDGERRFLRTFVGPFAQAIERARLYERQMSTVETLQRAILPQTLPSVDHLRLAARYLPAGVGVGVGGDWYDATVLADGTLSLVVGDVGGHGLRAVSTMAELYHAARAYALQLQAPADITTQLSANVGGGPDDPLATVVVARLDPVTRELTWSCAGHPPPLVLADGGARFLEEVHGPLLGVEPGIVYGQSTLVLPPRARLLLYTDGLVERRDRSLTDQLAALAAAVLTPPGPPEDPGRLCDHVLRAIAPAERQDDLCLIAVALP